MEEEKRRDSILDKFRGNKSFSMEDIHKEEFYESINSNYFVVENSINFLLADGSLEKRYNTDAGVEEFISLSHKGFFIISDLKKYGYEAIAINEEKKQEKEEREKRTNLFIQITTLIVTVLSLWLTLIQVFKSGNDNEGNQHHHNRCHHH